MARVAREPTFLPLTISTAGTLPPIRVPALRADAAAAECWAALLAGCDAPGRHQLPWRLRDLAEATSAYAGESWWNSGGFRDRNRIGQARTRIEEAIRDRDGADFAEAFIGYDQAVATAVARVTTRTRSAAR